MSETGAEVVLRSDSLHSLVDELGDRKERAKRGHPALRVSPLCPLEKITLHRDGQSIRIHIPLKFKRRGGRKEIIMPDNAQVFDGGTPNTQKPLVIALARAFRWQELLETGKAASIAALAKRLKVDRAYVSRILNLTLLAPDIVEAIMNGEEPSGLSLARLTKPFPVIWEEQCQEFGYAKYPQ